MSRRLAVLVLLAALMGGAVAIQQAEEDEPSTVSSFGIGAGDLAPHAAPLSALSSTWFCAAGGGSRAEDAPDWTIIVANPTDEQLAGQITYVPSEGEPATQPVEVPPLSRATFRAWDVLDAGSVAATVDLDGGGAVVEHAISSDDGLGIAPCASNASDRWFLANGATTTDATMLLALYNPFPGDAIVDIQFTTDEGRFTSPALQGLVIEGNRVSVLNLGEFVRRQSLVATTVLARSGRVVVDRVQRFSGADTRDGIDLALAAPATADTWYFPDGLVAEGVSERYYLYNPGEREAVVEIGLVLADGAAEPIERTIAPQGVVVVDPAEDGHVPPDVAHAATVRSLNGVAVVAEREISADTDDREGWASLLGGTAPATDWLLAAGGATDGTDAWVIVQNPLPQPVQVSLSGLADGQSLQVSGLQDLDLGPADRLGIRLGEHVNRGSLPIVVRATGPVVVQRDLYRVDGEGLSAVIGVPLSGR